MSIIRQINNTFAVPDLRNSATVVRLLIIVLGSLFFLPLISDSSLSYSTEIYHRTKSAIFRRFSSDKSRHDWVAPFRIKAAVSGGSSSKVKSG